MVYAIFAVAGENAKEAAKLTDENIRNAYNAGTGIGVMLLLFVWAAGAVLFGPLAHFTRGKRELIELETKVRS